MTRLSFWVRLHVLWRSFFFQAAANYERMQNVGFAYAMAPALGRLYQGEALQAAMKRHLQFFNSHPYLSAAVIGASLNLEEQVAAGTLAPSDVENLKRYTMGPLAAVGDSFFWSSLRPFAAAWAVAGIAAGVHWAPLAFLLLYNLFHLGIRGYGIFVGYRDGPQAITQMQQFGLVRLAGHVHYGSAFFIGIVGALIADHARASSLGLQGGLGPVLLFVMTLIFLLCIKRKIPTIGLLYAFAGAALSYVIVLNLLYPLL
jgi:PTS system mannose-specific IID component